MQLLDSRFQYDQEEERSISMEPAEWAASLPSDVMFMILDNLFESTDHIRFAAVCKGWNSLTKDYYKQSPRRSRQLVPMLMITLKTWFEKNTSGRGGALYSVSQQKTYRNFRFQIPGSTIHYGPGIHYSGAGHGWLARVVLRPIDSYRPIDGYYDFGTPAELGITLLNPFQSQGASITLPDYSSSHNLHEERFDISKRYSTLKIVLSADPTLNPDNYGVIFFCKYMGRHWELAFLTGGGKSWTVLVDNAWGGLWGNWYSDAVFYKGRGYAFSYSVVHKSQVITFDVESSSVEALQYTYTSQYDHNIPAYLVESTNGDLLCIRRFSNNSGRTQKFMVSKLILDQRGFVVDEVEVDNIGDNAVFVGNNSRSMCVLASKHRGCQPNCIYYTNDAYELGSHNLSRISLDMGVFNLEDETVTQLRPQISWDAFLLRPLWITPTFSEHSFTSS